MKSAKHVFVFFQATAAQNSLTHNPHYLDTFALGGGAELSTCCLQYGGSYYPELEYEGEDQTRIRRDLIDYRYRKSDYKKGTQLDVSNYSTLYPVIYFDLTATKEIVTGDSKKLILHYRLNQAANADYRIYAAVLNEEEIVIK